MTVVMLCCLCAGAFASEINSYEQKLIDYCNKRVSDKKKTVYTSNFPLIMPQKRIRI